MLNQLPSTAADEEQSSDEAFLGLLRHALNHLYDPDQLRTSPLIPVLTVEGQAHAATKLQHLLLDAIQALRPPTSEAVGSPKRRIHQILQLRYEQQFTQKEVATQLGLSVRQYRRLQHSALQALAFFLAERYALRSPVQAAVELAPAPEETDPPADSQPRLPESLQWVLSLSPTEETRLAAALPEVLRLVQPLADRHDKCLVVQGDLAAVAAIHPLVFRQAMLHLLNAAILSAGAGQIVVTVTAGRLDVTTTVAVEKGSLLGSAAAVETNIGYEMVRQMLSICLADLHTVAHNGGWQAVLTCTRVEQQPILVIDDHQDTLDLLQRYISDSRYRLITSHQPQRALELAQEHHPLLILLDVMMPAIDGWEVLTRLKQHETTAAIPVWVCTVLDQSELALSLGADGFLRKPITRQTLLSVLDGLSADQEPAQR
jgi:CheY-like chemotaxis protein